MKKRKPLVIILILAAALTALFLYSFILGHYDVPLREVIHILVTGRSDDPKMFAAVSNIRMPRILMACLVGCCLSAAGTSFQCVFRNPMASPDILGASSGACFGAALAILLDFSHSGITLFAFLFSLLSIALVYLIGKASRRNRVVAILLAGMMVSSLFSSVTSYIKLVADPSNQLPAITYWLMGSLSGTRKADLHFVVWPMLIGLIPLLLLRWRINLLRARACGPPCVFHSAAKRAQGPSALQRARLREEGRGGRRRAGRSNPAHDSELRVAEDREARIARREGRRDARRRDAGRRRARGGSS